jgi:hypothetical protein
MQRDRHGRGVRGPLSPAGSPLARSRAERFDELVLDAVERLDRGWHDQLARVEFAVEDVPDLDGWDRDWVPLTRASASRQLRLLVADVVAEQVAELVGVEPEEIDPSYGSGEPED